jgi:hypothetical protein
VTTPDPLEIRFRRRALEDGFSDADLERLVRNGSWSRIRRGAYIPGELPENLATRHRLLVHATMRGLLCKAVVSHQSAAVLLGIPLWNVPLDTVHVTRRPGATTRDRGRLRVHVARLRDDEIVNINGLNVTSPVRTALDLARSLPFEPAVVALDASLHRRLIDHDQLRQRLFDLAGTPGSRAAARAVAFADRRSESVGESRSRVALHALGIQPATLQLELATSDGISLGRADFGWERERVIGEFDGLIKYGRLLRPGQAPGDAVVDEKLREDAIRAENWGFVRWIWADLATPVRLGRRIQQALERGPGNRR